MKARRASVKVIYNDINITRDITRNLKSFSYQDVISDEADDISITLEDRATLWASDWMPVKGATLNISMVVDNWSSEETIERNLGLFEIDEVEIVGLPRETTIKAVSIPNNNKLRGIERSRSWEKIKLSAVAKDIATEADMELVFDSDSDNELERLEQIEESDLEFLLRVAKDAGLSLKVSDKQIIMFEESKLEQEETSITIRPGSSHNISYRFRNKTRGIYARAKVNYTDTQSGITYKAEFNPDESAEGKTLVINEQIKSVAEGERLAKKRLREKNKDEITANISMVGDIDYMAGVTVNMEDWGAFSGKYLITRASHNIGGGYTTNIELRRCLNGY